MRPSRGELLGLPGVGKSWIAQNGLAAIPGEASFALVPQGRTIDKLVNVLVGIKVGSVLVPTVVQYSMRNNDGSWRRRIRSTLLLFERLGRQMRQGRSDAYLIHDEGILQTLWSILLNSGITREDSTGTEGLFRTALAFTPDVYYVSCHRYQFKGRIMDLEASSESVAQGESSNGRNCMAIVLRQARKQGVNIRMVKNNRRSLERVGTEQPFVSVIIPMRNEAEYIEGCLQTLFNSEYPSELMEILVIDGVSDDGSDDIVTALSKSHSNLRLVKNPERITPTALNIGIGEAHGEVVVRMDVHSIYPADYISRCVANLSKYGADNVGGVWDIQPGANTNVARAIALAQAHPVGVGNIAYRLSPKSIKWVDTVPYGCYRKSVLEGLGGFDVELIRNQDDELNARLRGSGGKILLDPSIRCTYFARPTLQQIGRMFYQYGYFKPLAAHKIGKPYTIRQLAPPAFVVVMALLALGAVFFGFMRTMLIMLGGTYLVIVVAAAGKSALRRGIRVAIWIPTVFVTMHCAYGCGYIMGAINVVIRKNRTSDVPLTR